jgi:LacI family transcriptional regulator
MHPEILKGFARKSREAGWILNIFSVLHGTVPGDWRADGMLTTNVFRPDLRKFVRETARRIPTVLYGSNDLGFPVVNLESDERAIGRLAAEHLLELGHRHFASFRYSRNRHALGRTRGFAERLAEAGCQCTPLEKLSRDGHGAGVWLQERLKRLPRPLGLYTEDDMLAMRAIEAAGAAGWRVPGDLAIIGTGNLPLVCEQSEVPITSVGVPFEEEAYRAACLLEDLMNGRRPPRRPPVPVAPTGVIPRESTNAVAARHPVVRRALAWMAERQQEPDLSAAQVARACGVSIRLLYKVFEADLSSSPMAELLGLRLRSARRLLRHGEEKISAIAEVCGFANLRTFQRAFLRWHGCSATVWRAKQWERMA